MFGTVCEMVIAVRFVKGPSGMGDKFSIAELKWKPTGPDIESRTEVPKSVIIIHPICYAGNEYS